MRLSGYNVHRSVENEIARVVVLGCGGSWGPSRHESGFFMREFYVERQGLGVLGLLPGEGSLRKSESRVWYFMNLGMRLFRCL